MLEAMARIAPVQPNDAMKRTAHRSPMAPVVDIEIVLDPG
jgi:hypothetical protein